MSTAVPPPKGTIKVGGSSVQVDADDPWKVIGSTIKVVGRWWNNAMSKQDRKKQWPCQIAHFTSSYTWPEGEVSPTYFIESQGHLFPMCAADVYKLLAPATRSSIDAAATADEEQAPAFVLEQVLWLDKSHKKCILGKVSQYDCTLPMKDGKHRLKEDGGEHTEWSDRTEPKYKKEVRFLAGVAVDSGELTGHRTELFDYTGKWVVGVKFWREAVQAEVAHANRLKGYNDWKTTRNYTPEQQLAELEGGRYEAHYGEGWEAEVSAALAKGTMG